jgi:hypothetical protein
LFLFIGNHICATHYLTFSLYTNGLGYIFLFNKNKLSLVEYIYAGYIYLIFDDYLNYDFLKRLRLFQNHHLLNPGK